MEEMGIFSLADAKQIHAKCIGGKLVEAKEHTQPRGKAGGGGGAILAVTPAGGIAARTDSSFPITFPFAICNEVDPVTGDYYTPNRLREIFNSTNIAISPQSLIQAKLIGTRYFVDVDNCGETALDLPETAEPPPPP